MSTLDRPVASAVGVKIIAERLVVELSDGREVSIPLGHIPFLQQATPEARANWHLEPRGFAIYWPDLAEGLEVRHLLDPQPL
jgi:hypothetical protein